MPKINAKIPKKLKEDFDDKVEDGEWVGGRVLGLLVDAYLEKEFADVLEEEEEG